MQRPEQALQKAIAQFLAVALAPAPVGPFWTAINPIPSKTKAVAGLSKAMGLRAGVPDLLLIHRGRAHFVEVKAGSGRESVAQKRAAEELRHHGATYHVCRSLDDMASILTAIDVPMRAAAP